MLALLTLGGFAAIATVTGFVIFPYGRGNRVDHFRTLLVRSGDRCRAEGRSSPGTVTWGSFCTNYRNGSGCLRVWHMSGRRFHHWELHRR
jgi:hypothetical protein